MFGTILLTSILITLVQVSEPNIQYHVSGVVVHVQFPANNSVYCVHLTIKSRMDRNLGSFQKLSTGRSQEIMISTYSEILK